MRPRDSQRKSSFRRLGFCEHLEDRHLLSGHGLAFAPALQQFESQIVQSPAAQFAAHAITSAISNLTSSTSSHTVLTTTLTDSSGTATGTATYSTGTYDGTTVTQLRGLDLGRHRRYGLRCVGGRCRCWHDHDRCQWRRQTRAIEQSRLQ